MNAIETEHVIIIENADEKTLGHRGWGNEPRNSRAGVVN